MPPPSLDTSKLRGDAARLCKDLKAGRVYRRQDLAQLSSAVDRHLRELVAAGKLKKLAHGLYHAPKQSNFGPLPPEDEKVVGGFLRDKNFLVFSPSAYNTVGLGTTQLYNRTLVYNHKRHGVFRLGNRQFDFRMKPRFPKKVTLEFLYIDCLTTWTNWQKTAMPCCLRLAASCLSLTSGGYNALPPPLAMRLRESACKSG